MRGWKQFGFAARILALFLLALFLLALAPARAQTEVPLQLSVTLNGYPTGLIGEFLQRDGQLFVRPQEWAELGLRLPEPPGPDGLAALSAINDLQVRLDSATQTLFLTAPAALLLPQILKPPALRGSTDTVESGTGVTVNYDVTGSVARGQPRASGLFDLRGFTPFGTASTGLLAYANPASGRASLVRLDSGLSYADPDSMRRYRLGDTITGGLKWTRPVRLAGLQVQSDFHIRPDLITFPTPIVANTAAVPSTVDVLVNNAQALSGQVAPGPFQVAQLPIVTGASTITTTVTNALGQQVTTTLPFYASTDMLAEGLESYSAEMGWIRRNWGFVSNDYRELVGAASYQRGLSDILTGQAHMEAASGLVMGGAGLVMNVFNLGTVDVAVAGSVSRGRKGGQVSFGANHLGQPLSLGFSAILSDGGFRDLASRNGAPVPRRLLSANASLALGRYGALGLAYTGIRRDAAAQLALFNGGDPATGGFTLDRNGTVPSDLSTLVPAQHVELVSANYSVQLDRLSLYLTGFHDFTGNGGGAMLGVTMPLGPRSSATVSGGTAGAGAYGQFQAVQTPVSPGDWGYQAYALNNPDHQFLDVQYKSPWALVTGGVDQLSGTTTLRAQAQGSLSVMRGAGLFASNTINDSFAVVDTGGVPGVAVMAENRLVGRTNASGRLLVPELRAFEANHLSIEPNDIPITDSLGFAMRDVRPQENSGVLVDFPIARGAAALVTLTDAAGVPLPVGSAVEFAATGTMMPMGYDGAVYVEKLRPSGNLLRVTQPDGKRCTATFDYVAASGTIPRIGPLACRES